MKTSVKKQTFVIIMNGRETGANYIFGEIKTKRGDAEWMAFKLQENNVHHRFRVEEKKYFNANYGDISEYSF